MKSLLQSGLFENAIQSPRRNFNARLSGYSNCSYQAQVSGVVRILGVAREDAYETLHEPPSAGPHGERCGGWELETPGNPIMALRRQLFG